MRPVVIEQFSDKLFIITTNVIRFVTRLSVVVPKLWSHEALKKRYTETKQKERDQGDIKVMQSNIYLSDWVKGVLL